MAAFDRGDYATALREWRPLAEKGNAIAQSKLGFMYVFGEGVPKNYPRVQPLELVQSPLSSVRVFERR